MKRLFPLVAALAAAIALAPAPARSQVFGQLGGARPLGINQRLFGGYLSFSRSEASLLGQLRLSFHPGVDFGFQGGLARVKAGPADRTSVDLGGDFKVAVGTHNDQAPLDVSLGAAIGVRSADGFNLLSVGPSVAASRSFSAGHGGEITPYVGLALMFTRNDLGGTQTTDLSVPIRLGAELKPNPDFRVVAEVLIAAGDAIRDDLGFTIGMNVPF